MASLAPRERISSGEVGEVRGAASSPPKAAQNPKVHRKNLFFGDDKEQQLQELLARTSDVGIELAVLLKTFKRTLRDACEISEANVKMYCDMTTELDAIVDADIKGGEQLVERTLALSLELQEIDSVKLKVANLDKTLEQYEDLAYKLIKQTRDDQRP